MEAIIITAIIVGGIVGLAWVALHFGYKAWLEGRADEKLAEAEAKKHTSVYVSGAQSVSQEEFLRLTADRLGGVATTK